MSVLFDDLKEGLEEAIAFTKGEGAGRKTTFVAADKPVDTTEPGLPDDGPSNVQTIVYHGKE